MIGRIVWKSIRWNASGNPKGIGAVVGYGGILAVVRRLYNNSI